VNLPICEEINAQRKVESRVSLKIVISDVYYRFFVENVNLRPVCTNSRVTICQRQNDAVIDERMYHSRSHFAPPPAR